MNIHPLHVSFLFTSYLISNNRFLKSFLSSFYNLQFRFASALSSSVILDCSVIRQKIEVERSFADQHQKWHRQQNCSKPVKLHYVNAERGQFKLFYKGFRYQLQVSRGNFSNAVLVPSWAHD